MVETKRRGRPSKDTSDTNSNVYTIKDPLMEPFHIVKDPSNFTVIETSISTRGFAGRKATGKEIEKNIGYFTSFKHALNCIAREKFHTSQEEYSSLKEYIASWDEVKTGLETLLNKVNI